MSASPAADICRATVTKVFAAPSCTQTSPLIIWRSHASRAPRARRAPASSPRRSVGGQRRPTRARMRARQPAGAAPPFRGVRAEYCRSLESACCDRRCAAAPGPLGMGVELCGEPFIEADRGHRAMPQRTLRVGYDLGRAAYALRSRTDVAPAAPPSESKDAGSAAASLQPRPSPQLSRGRGLTGSRCPVQQGGAREGLRDRCTRIQRGRQQTQTSLRRHPIEAGGEGTLQAGSERGGPCASRSDAVASVRESSTSASGFPAASASTRARATGWRSGASRSSSCAAPEGLSRPRSRTAN